MRLFVRELRLWEARRDGERSRGRGPRAAGWIDHTPIHDELSRITCPTLVMVGDQDVATVPAKAERIHAAIPGSRLVVIPGAGHTSSAEEPEFVNAALAELLRTIPVQPRRAE